MSRLRSAVFRRSVLAAFLLLFLPLGIQTVKGGTKTSPTIAVTDACADGKCCVYLGSVCVATGEPLTHYRQYCRPL